MSNRLRPQRREARKGNQKHAAAWHQPADTSHLDFVSQITGCHLLTSSHCDMTQLENACKHALTNWKGRPTTVRSVYLLFCDTENWVQVLSLSYNSGGFVFVLKNFFLTWCSVLLSCPNFPWTCDPPVSDSQITANIGIHHHSWLRFIFTCFWYWGLNAQSLMHAPRPISQSFLVFTLRQGLIKLPKLGLFWSSCLSLPGS